MTVIMIDRHLERQLIDLHINRDEWSIITNSALSEKLKKEALWADRDAEGYCRSEPNKPNNGSILSTCETIIEQINKIKDEFQVKGKDNLPKEYFCLKCGYYHKIPNDFLTHLKFKGEPTNETLEYYKAVKEERYIHHQITAFIRNKGRAERRGDKEKIKYNQQQIDKLIPLRKEKSERVNELKELNNI